jgi:hypothetical protein
LIGIVKNNAFMVYLYNNKTSNYENIVNTTIAYNIEFFKKKENITIHLKTGIRSIAASEPTTATAKQQYVHGHETQCRAQRGGGGGRRTAAGTAAAPGAPCARTQSR